MAAILLGVVPREDGKDGVAESGLLGDEVAVGLIDDGDDWSRGFGPAHLHVLEGTEWSGLEEDEQIVKVPYRWDDHG